MAEIPKHVLITGGSRGIGLAIAQLFARKAYRCTLIAGSEDRLKMAFEKLEPLQSTGVNGLGHSYIAGNISKGSDFWNTNDKKWSSFGSSLPQPSGKNPQHPSRIDVLVNCAGVSQAKLFQQMEDDKVHDIINTNLISMMIGTKFLLRKKYFRKKEDDTPGPVIINVSSLLALRSGYGTVAYSASKAGVIGFTQALANEYALHGVRVNALVPGYVETDMTKELDREGLEKRIPLQRFGRPQEIAEAALFLAENGYAHNCVLNIDGGLSAV